MSQGVYESIGYQDATGMAQKAGLVLTLHNAITAFGMTLTAAAERLDVSPEELELILGGRFRDVQPEDLLLWLRRLGFDIRVTLTAPEELRHPGSIAISPLPHQR